MAIDPQILAGLLPSFRAALVEAEAKPRPAKPAAVRAPAGPVPAIRHPPRETQILDAIGRGQNSWEALLEVTKLDENRLGEVLARMWSGGKVRPYTRDGVRRFRITRREAS